jgi:catechol 2,3-dioxygenase-like lactoylglutathione lyase family enzyme
LQAVDTGKQFEMKRNIRMILILTSTFLAGFVISRITACNDQKCNMKESGEVNKVESSKIKQMSLGAFSISLSVKDLVRSKKFYEELGFESFAGDTKSNYLIMKRGNALIGLFHGMFDGNIMTFNPGWDENAQNLSEFEDVRAIQKRLKTSGIILESEADENSNGPASFMLKDPDGNLILFDQHREKK